MKILSAVTITLLLTGCAMGSRPKPTPPAPRACAAENVQRFVGRPATPALVDQVRRASGSTVARRITPEMRVTMEFRPDRVNVWVGLKGEVERISCG